MTLPRLFCVVLLIGALLIPATASAQIMRSFGGRVLKINLCINGAVQFTILPAMPSAYVGLASISYVWLPTTRNNVFSLVPARWPFPGQRVVGVAFPIPYACFGPGIHPIEYVGLPVLYMNTSLTF